VAKGKVVSLIVAKKIDESWKEPYITSTKKKEFNDIPEWVGFENGKIEDKSKQILYIFLTLEGKVTGANYTGN